MPQSTRKKNSITDTIEGKKQIESLNDSTRDYECWSCTFVIIANKPQVTCPASSMVELWVLARQSHLPLDTTRSRIGTIDGYHAYYLRRMAARKRRGGRKG